jgi:hypothetical protein
MKSQAGINWALSGFVAFVGRNILTSCIGILFWLLCFTFLYDYLASTEALGAFMQENIWMNWLTIAATIMMTYGDYILNEYLAIYVDEKYRI